MPRETGFRQIQVDENRDLLTRKELAWCLRVHVNYIHAMVAWGFDMPGGTAKLTEARDWLKRNPEFNTKERPKSERECKGVV